ncbi:MAG: hypothetical protein WBF17_08060 [Phycisphaerae bacterium]
MRTTTAACLIVALSAASAAWADGPKLVGETVLTKVYSEFYGIPGIVRLSPDGERLLFTRPAPAKQGPAPQPGAAGVGPKQGHQVVLHQWRTGKETVVPVPLVTDVVRAPITTIANPFGADGKLLVVPAGVDEDGDGVWAVRQEKVQPAVYNIESGKLTRIGVQEVWMSATFDAAGKHLIFTVVEKMRPPAGKTYVAPVETLKPKALATWGLPLAPRPGGNTLVLAEVIVPPDGGPPVPKLVLYDFVKDAKVADLPVHERNRPLGSFAPQWTADGRYLYYPDAEREPAGEEGRTERKLFTRVWDAQESKEVARLSDCMPIGPCGGATMMVLSKGDSASALLHDARTGKEQPLSDSTAIHPISTTGKYLIYDRKDGRGEHVVCRAEINVARE